MVDQDTDSDPEVYTDSRWIRIIKSLDLELESEFQNIHKSDSGVRSWAGIITPLTVFQKGLLKNSTVKIPWVGLEFWRPLGMFLSSIPRAGVAFSPLCSTHIEKSLARRLQKTNGTYLPPVQLLDQSESGWLFRFFFWVS